MRYKSILIFGVLLIINIMLIGCAEESNEAELKVNKDEEVISNVVENKYNNFFITDENSSAIAPELCLGDKKPVDEQNISDNGLVVRYGKNYYKCKTQTEYDQVMSVIDEVVQNYDYKKSNLWYGYELWQKEVMGETINKEDGLEINNDFFVSNDSALSDFKEKTKSWLEAPKEIINSKVLEKLLIAEIYRSYIWDNISGLRIIDEEFEGSAFDTLIYARTNKAATAQAILAIYDRLGFTTSLRSNNEDIWVEFKIGDNWWNSNEYVGDEPSGDI